MRTRYDWENIRMEYEAGMRLTAPDSHIEGIKREAGINRSEKA